MVPSPVPRHLNLSSEMSSSPSASLPGLKVAIKSQCSWSRWYTCISLRCNSCTQGGEDRDKCDAASFPDKAPEKDGAREQMVIHGPTYHWRISPRISNDRWEEINIAGRTYRCLSRQPKVMDYCDLVDSQEGKSIATVGISSFSKAAAKCLNRNFS